MYWPYFDIPPKLNEIWSFSFSSVNSISLCCKISVHSKPKKIFFFVMKILSTVFSPSKSIKNRSYQLISTRPTLQSFPWSLSRAAAVKKLHHIAVKTQLFVDCCFYDVVNFAWNEIKLDITTVRQLKACNFLSLFELIIKFQNVCAWLFYNNW